jgi:stage IV sporulation protein B
MESRITQIHRGEAGAPGELVGQFGADSESLGSIDQNGACGIYGNAYDAMSCTLYPQGLPILSADEVQTGSAQILTTLDDSGIHAYDCEITKISRQSGQTQRNLILRITDEELLLKTGGIVQGMSGSPIIQDGKLVGAVTHVLVNDPTRGYGIFIENMLEAAS